MLSDAAELPDNQVQPLLDALWSLTGIAIPVSKKTMVLFRLRKRLAELQHPPLPQYVANLRQDKKEQQVFINLLTTNETSFFRTRTVWEFFRQELLLNYANANPSPLRVWSAASSTGEEACSVAMSCLEFQRQHPAFRFHILATDVDTAVLAQAASGVFRAASVNRLKHSHPALFERHFTPAGEGACQVDAAVRRGIRFATHNLIASPRRFMPQDVIFLRNVLIYFRESEQKKIVTGIAEGMSPGAVLILGESESLSSIDAPLAFVQPQIYRRVA